MQTCVNISYFTFEFEDFNMICVCDGEHERIMPLSYRAQFVWAAGYSMTNLGIAVLRARYINLLQNVHVGAEIA